MDDTGIKWVYLEDTSEGLKIISEEWFRVNRALKGANWNRKRPRIVEVVEDIADIVIGEDGKLAISEADRSFPENNTVKPEAVVLMVQNAEKQEKSETPELKVSHNSPVVIEGLQIVNSINGRTKLFFRLVNKNNRGAGKRQADSGSRIRE